MMLYANRSAFDPDAEADFDATAGFMAEPESAGHPLGSIFALAWLPTRAFTTSLRKSASTSRSWLPGLRLGF